MDINEKLKLDLLSRRKLDDLVRLNVYDDGQGTLQDEITGFMLCEFQTEATRFNVLYDYVNTLDKALQEIKSRNLMYYSWEIRK